MESPASPANGLTLARFAREKVIDLSYLRKLGFTDAAFGGLPAIRIPYWDADRRESAVRFRIGMYGDRFRWEAGAQTSLYGLWRLKRMSAAGFVVLVEGESDAITLWWHRIPALGLPGANIWKEEWAAGLDAFDRIYVVVEPDRGGEAVLRRLSKSSIRERIHLVRLDNAKDASELYLQQSPCNPRFPLPSFNFREEFQQALEAAIPLSEDAGSNGTPQPEEADSKAGPSQASELISIASAADLFRSEDDKPYATLPVNGHKETWPVGSKRFRQWLARTFYSSEKIAPRAQSLQDALNVITGRAMFEGKQQAVFTRIAEWEGKIFLDLTDSAWRAVEITPDGWRIINDPPVRFRRARTMSAFPEPCDGGDISELRSYINARSARDWIMIFSWLITALKARGPFPILGLHGEQGCGKSTLARILRSLIDPNTASLRSAPRDARDLMITAINSHVISFDNLSHLPVWLSDALCRLATGGGFGTRELYTDDDEVVFDAMRPILLNGIGEVTSRGDLMERTVLLDLPRIPKAGRLPEEEFWRRFEAARPRILGALLNATSTALRNVGSVHLAELPRMADFAKWSAAAEPVLGFKPGAFMRAYSRNLGDANSIVLDASPVAACIRKLLNVEELLTWNGTATELLDALTQLRGPSDHARDAWPRSANGLAGVLRRLAPNFRAIGMAIDFDREAGTGQRMIQIRLEDR